MGNGGYLPCDPHEAARVVCGVIVSRKETPCLDLLYKLIIELMKNFSELRNLEITILHYFKLKRKKYSSNIQDK